MMISRASALTAAMACLVAPLPAQVPHLIFNGEELWALSEVAPVGDVDGDGINDLVLGAPFGRFILMGQLIIGGAVQLVSGRDGHLLHPTIFGVGDDIFGFAVAGAGDFDGDGIPDFVGGSPWSDGFQGEIDVWSGKTGLLITRIPPPVPPTGILNFGVTVTGLGDLNSDGFSEVAGTFSDICDVVIHRGPDGALIRIYRSSDGSGEPGTGGVGIPDVASLGDVDADGVPDYVIGWHWGDGSGKNGPGLVVLYSGATGKEVFRVRGADVGGEHLGFSVARMGDMDGDGITDFVAGDPLGLTVGPDKSGGAAFILSGVDGSLIRRIYGPRSLLFMLGDNFRRVDGGQDVNGDGVPDLIVGNQGANPHPGSSGNLEVYSGATGTMLWRVRPNFSGALLGDLNGDGLSEWAHGDRSRDAPQPQTGQVTVYLGSPGDAHRVCTAKPNSTGRKARLELDGPISLRANQLALYVEHAVPNQSGYFIYGPDLVKRPFGDGVLCAGGGSLGLRRMGGLITLDSSGSVLTEIDMNQGEMASGPAAWTVGSTWTLQFYYRDPGGAAGFNLSDAMRVTWTP
ncbi:MAG: integrin alpha [Longimicrobiales bacterium]